MSECRRSFRYYCHSHASLTVSSLQVMMCRLCPLNLLFRYDSVTSTPSDQYTIVNICAMLRLNPSQVQLERRDIDWHLTRHCRRQDARCQAVQPSPRSTSKHERRKQTSPLRLLSPRNSPLAYTDPQAALSTGSKEFWDAVLTEVGVPIRRSKRANAAQAPSVPRKHNRLRSSADRSSNETDRRPQQDAQQASHSLISQQLHGIPPDAQSSPNSCPSGISGLVSITRQRPRVDSAVSMLPDTDAHGFDGQEDFLQPNLDTTHLIHRPGSPCLSEFESARALETISIPGKLKHSPSSPHVLETCSEFRQLNTKTRRCRACYRPQTSSCSYEASEHSSAALPGSVTEDLPTQSVHTSIRRSNQKPAGPSFMAYRPTSSSEILLHNGSSFSFRSTDDLYDHTLPIRSHSNQPVLPPPFSATQRHYSCSRTVSQPPSIASTPPRASPLQVSVTPHRAFSTPSSDLSLQTLPRTPFTVYNDNRPPFTQPQTPADLARTHPQNHFNTAPQPRNRSLGVMGLSTAGRVSIARRPAATPTRQSRTDRYGSDAENVGAVTAEEREWRRMWNESVGMGAEERDRIQRSGL